MIPSKIKLARPGFAMQISGDTVDKEYIRQKLKGRESQRNFDQGDHNLNPNMEIPKTLVPAAVLVPLVLRSDGIRVLLTQRTDHLKHHPGQISFPGGHVDSGDKTPEDTALRETQEEVGLSHQHIEILGRLDQYRVRTGFVVTPVVGFVTPPFEIEPDHFEVAAVFEVPLCFIMDPVNHTPQKREYRGQVRHFYGMTYDEHYIWGATAGMLINLHSILTKP